PPAHGSRRGDPGVPDHCARGRRKLLGRGAGGAAGWPGDRTHRRLRLGMVVALDLHPARGGGVGTDAGPVRQEKPAGGLMNEARLVTPAMLGLWAFLATVPLWIERVGLYPYLGVEILIWSI